MTSPAELVPADGLAHGYKVKEAPAGSGEGIVQNYFVKITVQEGKRKIATLRRDFHGVGFRVDEVQALDALAARAGRTTMTTIRQAWSGEDIGGSYSSEDKRAHLGAHDYRMTITIGVQPEHAKTILADNAGGTPQRITWFGLSDPDAPPPDELPSWPGRLEWTPPR